MSKAAYNGTSARTKMSSETPLNQRPVEHNQPDNKGNGTTQTDPCHTKQGEP